MIPPISVSAGGPASPLSIVQQSRKDRDMCFRKSALTTLLLSVATHGGCARNLVPRHQLRYRGAGNAHRRSAVARQNRGIAKPLPLPGQLKPLAAGKRIPEAADPKVLVEQANAAARVQPVRTGFINAVQVRVSVLRRRSLPGYTAPGQITAQITEAVYDSPWGKSLLVPQGANLIGQYDSSVAFGQSRTLLVWTRIIMPDRNSIVLERQPGADTGGHAGLEDEVDNHWGMLLKTDVLSTLLCVGAEAGTGQDENNLVQAIRSGASSRSCSASSTSSRR
ncbi:hypothetical protein ACVWZ3_000065 [Bradyrhizobium sp. i1.3.6]